jgi:tetratricopeptide (TPR) repeat protein
MTTPTSAASLAVAVLPFENASGDPARDYLAAGISEWLRNGLLGLRALRVASRGATLGRAASTPPGELATALGASAALHGSARILGSQLTLTVQLTRAGGERAWGDQLDRKTDELPAALAQVLGQVAAALGMTPDDTERDTIGYVPTQSGAAFDAYLRARFVAGQVRRRAQDLARDLYTQATQADPAFALAHAGIADCHALLFNYWDSGEDNLRQADVSSARAVELAPSVAEVRVSRGAALAANRRYDEADTEFAAALARKPGLFEAHYYYARACRSAGRMEDAVRHFEAACAAWPESYGTHALLASVYVSLGRSDDARATQRTAVALAERQLEDTPDDERALYLGAGALSALGDRAKARDWAKRALAMEPDDSAVLYNVACVYALLGLRDSAVDCLDQAITNGFGHWEWIEHDSDLDSLRELPRFKQLLDRRQA